MTNLIRNIVEVFCVKRWKVYRTGGIENIVVAAVFRCTGRYRVTIAFSVVGNCNVCACRGLSKILYEVKDK